MHIYKHIRMHIHAYMPAHAYIQAFTLLTYAPQASTAILSACASPRSPRPTGAHQQPLSPIQHSAQQQHQVHLKRRSILHLSLQARQMLHRLPHITRQAPGTVLIPGALPFCNSRFQGALRCSSHPQARMDRVQGALAGICGRSLSMAGLFTSLLLGSMAPRTASLILRSISAMLCSSSSSSSSDNNNNSKAMLCNSSQGRPRLSKRQQQVRPTQEAHHPRLKRKTTGGRAWIQSQRKSAISIRLMNSLLVKSGSQAMSPV